VSESSSERPIVVYGAIIGNLLIAISKFVVATLSGSSAMLTEAIHSTADTGNQGLILLGLRRSKKPADDLHPFGHGQELYFWGLIVAVVLFGIGGGFSIYEGITHIRQPSELGNPTWNYVVLGIAFVAEGITWFLAIRELLNRKKADESFWDALHNSKDPSVYSVLGEDSAALLGIFVAFFGVFLGHRLDMPVLDGVASLIVGIILVVVALFLVYESKGLIVGESTDADIVSRIRRISEADPAVDKVESVLTMHFGPQDVLLNMNVSFRPELSGAKLPAAVKRLESAIQREAPDIKRIFIETRSLTS
jgi:cation diffusion facilitator family transporter